MLFDKLFEMPDGSGSGEVVKLAMPRTIHLVPMDTISGFDVRPGF